MIERAIIRMNGNRYEYISEVSRADDVRKRKAKERLREQLVRSVEGL